MINWKDEITSSDETEPESDQERKIYRDDRENLDWFEYFAERLHIEDKVQREARDYYQNELKRGYNSDELMLVAVSMYIQSRQAGKPRSRKQFSKVISDLVLDRRKTDTFKELTDIYLKIRKSTDIDMRTIRPYEFLDFLSDELDLTEEQVESTREVCEQMISNPSFSGRDPMCICGAGLMTATENVSMDELAEATATSSTTIDNIKEIIDNETEISS